MSLLITNEVRTTSGKTLLRSTGGVIQTTTVTVSGEITLSYGTSGTMFSTSFTKLENSSTSDIHITWKIPGCGNNSYVCGTYIEVGGVRSYENRFAYTPYAEPDGHLWGVDTWTTLGAGSNTITTGWSVASGGGGDGPYQYINPVQGRNDGRRRGPAFSKFTIFEVLK